MLIMSSFKKSLIVEQFQGNYLNQFVAAILNSGYLMQGQEPVIMWSGTPRKLGILNTSNHVLRKII